MNFFVKINAFFIICFFTIFFKSYGITKEEAYIFFDVTEESTDSEIICSYLRLAHTWNPD